MRARRLHKGNADGSDGLVRFDQAIEGRLTYPKIPCDILHIGGPTQSGMTLQQCADGFASPEPVTLTHVIMSQGLAHEFSSISATICPALTTRPGWQRNSRSFPAMGAAIAISIFIDSVTRST